MKAFVFLFIGINHAAQVSMSVPPLSSTIPKINLDGITEGGRSISLNRIYSQKSSVLTGGYGMIIIILILRYMLPGVSFSAEPNLSRPGFLTLILTNNRLILEVQIQFWREKVLIRMLDQRST
jgi:hypothetical protein